MADSGIFGKTLMGQRPQNNDNDDELDDLDYYIYSGNNSGEAAEKSEADEEESITEKEDLSAVEDDLEIVDDDVELFHSENINPDGTVKEFDFYDDELPLDLEVGTSTAAKSLRCTEQTIRNYCRDYQDYLDIHVVNGRRKLTIKTLRKLDKIMQVKEERKYDREQMKAYLRNEGRESLAVTEEEKFQLLSEMVSKKITEELMDKFYKDDGLLSQFSFQLSKLVDEKLSLDQEKLQIDVMNRQVQASFEQLIQKEDEIKGLIEQLSSQRADEDDRQRFQKLEERLDAAQKETSELVAVSRQKDEEIARLQSDIEQLKANSKKKKFLFFK